MSWSYDAASLSDPINEVRLFIGDTNENDQQLQNEEIQLFIDASSTTSGAAVMALRVLCSKYARYVDKWVGDLKILASQRYRAYKDQLAQMETGGGGILGLPYAGGIRISDKCATEADTDLVKPSFARDLHDFQPLGPTRRRGPW
jgi:hypothetical protein